VEEQDLHLVEFKNGIPKLFLDITDTDITPQVSPTQLKTQSLPPQKGAPIRKKRGRQDV
jgi:hypothetical protein